MEPMIQQAPLVGSHGKLQVLKRLKDSCTNVWAAIRNHRVIQGCDVSNRNSVVAFFKKQLQDLLNSNVNITQNDMKNLNRKVDDMSNNSGDVNAMLRDFYRQLEKEESGKKQKSVPVDLGCLCSINIYEEFEHSDIQRKIIHGQKLRVRGDNIMVVFTLLTTNLMTAHIKHVGKPSLFEEMVTINMRDLSKLFKDAQTFFKYLKSLLKVEVRLTDEGSLQIWIQRISLSLLGKTCLIATKFSSFNTGMLQFNESETYYSILQHRHHPYRPFPAYLAELVCFHTEKQIREKIALELFAKCLFRQAARIYRTIIDESPEQQRFQGRGNDEDLLHLRNSINQGDQQHLLKGLSCFDCLFICEYMNIDLEESCEWYEKKYELVESGALGNRAIVYGILNFCHRNHYNFMGDMMIWLCQKLSILCYGQCQIIQQKSSQLLASIYFALNNIQRAAVHAKRVIKLNIENNEGWLILHRIDGQQSKDIRYRILQAERKLVNPNDFHKAKDILGGIIKECPSYIPAYHLMLKAERLELKDNLDCQRGDAKLQTIECINRAEKCEYQCLQQNPNDPYIKYLLARILELSTDGLHIQRSKKIYSECLRMNPYMEKAKSRLALARK